MTQSTDFIEQLAALAKIERDLAAKFQTDRVGLGEWIDAMGAVNGYIRENVPAILALGRERDALRGALKPFAFLEMEKDEGLADTQYVWETIFNDRVQDWFDFSDIEAARQALAEAG